MPRCSIIILAHNHASLTLQCLHAIHDTMSDRISYEIIVANDGSTDLTAQFLATYGDQLRVVTSPTNQGFATACNAGAAIATGEFLIFLNNDTVPQVGWLEALVDYAETHQKAAILGSKLVRTDGTIQCAGAVVRWRNHYPSLMYHGFPQNHPVVNKSRRLQIVAGACMFVRREWFEQVRGFDLGYRNGVEDADICLRVGQKGGETHYCHQSVILHLASATYENQLVEAVRNIELYHSRWAARTRPDDINYYLEDGQLLLIFQEIYDLLRQKARLRSRIRPLKARLRTLAYSDNTLPPWFSILRGAMIVMLFCAHILRFAQTHRKGKSS